MAKRFARGQSVLEYALLIGVALVALMIMQVYIKRGYQGGIKAEVDQVGAQYAPNHTTSVSTTVTNTTSESYTGGQTEAGGLLGPAPHDVWEGVSVTVSTTNTTTRKREAVDAFKLEEF